MASRTVVLLSGGRLGLKSKVGEGSCFWIELPCEWDFPECDYIHLPGCVSPVRASSTQGRPVRTAPPRELLDQAVRRQRRRRHGQERPALPSRTSTRDVGPAPHRGVVAGLDRARADQLPLLLPADLARDPPSDGATAVLRRGRRSTIPSPDSVHRSAHLGLPEAAGAPHEHVGFVGLLSSSGDHDQDQVERAGLCRRTCTLRPSSLTKTGR